MTYRLFKNGTVYLRIFNIKKNPVRLEKKNAGSARIRISFLNADLHPRIYLECDAQARKDGAAAQLHIRFVHEQRGDTVPST